MAVIHAGFARTLLMFVFALGVWASWDFMRKQGVSPSYWGAVAIGELLMIVQGILGIVLVVSGAMPHDLLHFLYGVVVALAYPGTYVYTHARTGRKEAAIYAVVSFTIFALALRATSTGGGNLWP